MLRGNLSSRPFYNERLVSLALAGLLVLASALAVFNGTKIFQLSKQRAALKNDIARDTGEAQSIERRASEAQGRIDRATLTRLAVSTQEANALIDHRTFSWTVFFGLLEQTLPMDARLVSVTPRVDRDQIRLTIGVAARRLDDIDAFMDNLQGTGAFYDLLATNTERVEDDNTFRADVVAYYLAPNRVLPAASSGSGARKGRR